MAYAYTTAKNDRVRNELQVYESSVAFILPISQFSCDFDGGARASAEKLASKRVRQYRNTTLDAGI